MKTTKEAAEILGLTEARITQLIKAGKLRAVKFGSNWAIDDQSIFERKETDHPKGRPAKKKALK